MKTKPSKEEIKKLRDKKLKAIKEKQIVKK